MATIDDTGYTPETQGERKQALDADCLAAFPAQGEEFLDLTPDSPLGRFNTIFAEQLVKQESLTAAFIDILDPTQATGVWADYHLRSQATGRKQATFSQIPALLQGTPGTLVGDKRVRFLSNDSLWRTPATDSDGNPLAIEANGFLATTLTAAASGPINAVETGTSQWVIVDRVVGWETVESTGDATLGSDIEADSTVQARLQRNETAARGVATAPGILKRLFELDGVTDAALNNNRSLLPQNGIPGKHIEAIVEGGDLQEIANTILATYQGTAGFFGLTSVEATATVTLEDGTQVVLNEVVKLTRPENVPIIARYTITYGRPDLAPEDGGVALALEAASSYINNAGRDVDVVPTASGSAVTAALPPASEPVVVAEVAIKGNPLAFATIPISVRQKGFTNPEPQAAIVTGTQTEPFNFIVTWVLVLSVDGAAPVAVTFAATDFEVVSQATALEVSNAIGRQVGTLTAGVDEGAVELASQTQGAASSIEILNTSSAALLAELGLSVGVVNGSDGDIEVVIA